LVLFLCPPLETSLDECCPSFALQNNKMWSSIELMIDIV
jgi:hypothetical protein